MMISRPAAALALLGVALSCTPAADANDVTLLPTPHGGRPVAARADRGGTIHLLFEADGGPRYARSADGGLTFGPSLLVVGEGARAEGLEFTAWDLDVGGDGRVHVALGTNAWKLKLPREEWGYFYASLPPGATAFTPPRNLSRTPSEGFSLAADDRGNVTACWLAGKLYASVSRDHGVTFAPPAEIDASFNPCDCCTTSVAYGRDGRLAVLYREETNNERDMYLVLWDQQRGEATRERVGRTPWVLGACPMTYFAVAPSRGGFVATWPTKGEVYFAHSDGRGLPLRRAEVSTPGRAGMRSGVLALTSPDGRTLVAWKANGRAGWQPYDQEDRPIGAPGSVESPGNGIAGVVGKDGRFILYR